MSTSREFRLSREEVLRFHDQGYLGPYTLCSPEEMRVIARRIEREVSTTTARWQDPLCCRHLDCPTVYEVSKHPGIIEKMASLYGEDLLLWRTQIFVKPPLSQEIHWHQDVTYWSLDPPINLSAWVALDRAGKENSCLQLLPGSHKVILPLIPAPAETQFPTMSDLSGIDVNRSIDMELQPGEFILFNGTILHRSAANMSDKTRCALSVRVTVPFVQITPPVEDQKPVLVKGEDRFGINEKTAFSFG